MLEKLISRKNLLQSSRLSFTVLLVQSSRLSFTVLLVVAKKLHAFILFYTIQCVYCVYFLGVLVTKKIKVPLENGMVVWGSYTH